jgi:hypothetical protein
MLTYSTPPHLSHQEAERLFASGTSAEICDSLVSVALNDEDWRWSQTQCLKFLEHRDINVRGLAATCLGHIARIHRNLDRELVIKALQQRLQEPEISAQVEDALQDIEMFLHSA